MYLLAKVVKPRDLPASCHWLVAPVASLIYIPHNAHMKTRLEGFQLASLGWVGLGWKSSEI